MFDENTLTLLPPYPAENELEFPEDKNLAEFLLRKTSELIQEGLSDFHWITNVETGEFLTFKDVEPLSKSIARNLYKRGMRRGDVILHSSHEITKLHVFFLGVWRANGIVKVCYPDEDEQNIAAKIIESKVRWFLCDPHSVLQVSNAVKKVPWPVEIIVFGQDQNDFSGNCTLASELFYSDSDDDEGACPKLEVEGDDIAIILATSGTTGACKGAVYTHSGFIKTLVTRQNYLLNDDHHPFLSLGKQTHISGSTFPWTALLSRRQILMTKNATSKNILQAVHQYKPSLLIGFPKFLMCLVDGVEASKFDLSSVCHIMVGGVIITPNFISAMESLPGVRVIVYYGMTECGIFSTSQNFGVSIAKNGSSSDRIWQNVPDFSVGKLPPGTMMQVRDLETDALLGPNQRGELHFKSAIICAGYLNRPEESADAFPNGWVKTGDIGYFDENGFIFVVDRCKEIFKYYNNHISPSELENVIHRHPAVESVCVVGIPDPEGGDKIPRAFVTLKDPLGVAEDIRSFANGNLAPYKRLRGGLIVLPELPLGKSGKVSRLLLSQIQIAF